MSQHDGLGYNAFKVFVILFILTALEVFWGLSMRGAGRFVLWGGLLTFAVVKGLLILMYFMHMKFEKMVVWSLILPTPLLIAVVVGALMPDISFNDHQLNNPIGSMRQPSGVVVGLSHTPEHGAAPAVEPGAEATHGSGAGEH